MIPEIENRMVVDSEWGEVEYGVKRKKYEDMEEIEDGDNGDCFTGSEA